MKNSANLFYLVKELLVVKNQIKTHNSCALIWLRKIDEFSTLKSIRIFPILSPSGLT